VCGNHLLISLSTNHHHYFIILMLPDLYRGYNPCFSQSYDSYSSRGQTIAPSHTNHITARRSNICLPTPRSSLDSPRNLPSSDVHGPKAISSPHLAVDQNNAVSLKDHATISLPTDATISLPTPLERPPSLDSVLSRLKPLLDRAAQVGGERKVTIVGITSDIVDKLRENSELPGWENLRYVGFSSLVFGKCT
jgi:hypothetical protein